MPLNVGRFSEEESSITTAHQSSLNSLVFPDHLQHHLNIPETQTTLHPHLRNIFNSSPHSNSQHRDTQMLILIIATGTIIILFILIIIICAKKNKYLQSNVEQNNIDFDSPNNLSSRNSTKKNSSLTGKNKGPGIGKKIGFFKNKDIKSNDYNFTVPTIVITTASLKRKNYKDDEFDL
uniref:Uncharacterized protein n=1 Tax=Parastrongyloides trichosuri TaxID=131310 RepID=A0A0N4ZR03_PARTI